jgi:hypothetical protein
VGECGLYGPSCIECALYPNGVTPPSVIIVYKYIDLQ